MTEDDLNSRRRHSALSQLQPHHESMTQVPGPDVTAEKKVQRRITQCETRLQEIMDRTRFLALEILESDGQEEEEEDGEDDTFKEQELIRQFSSYLNLPKTLSQKNMQQVGSTSTFEYDKSSFDDRMIQKVYTYS